MDNSTSREISPLLSSAGLFFRARSISPFKTSIGIEDTLHPQETLSYISDPSTSPTLIQDTQLQDLLQDAEHQVLVCFPIVSFYSFCYIYLKKVLTVVINHENDKAKKMTNLILRKNWLRSSLSWLCQLTMRRLVCLSCLHLTYIF